MRYVLLIPVLIAAGLAVFSFTVRSGDSQPHQYVFASTPGLVSAQAYMLPASDPAYAPIRDTTVPDPLIDANAAILYDLDTGSYLYEKNIDIKVPIASLTKLLSVLVVQDLFDAREVVTVASGSVRVDGQKQTLYDNERITVGNLVSMMLVESSNDAAYALADYSRTRGIDFIARMNAKAAELGMRDCLFTDPAGLDDNAYCTVRDLVRLVRSALRTAPQIWPIMAIKELQVVSADGVIAHTVKSTDELLGQVPGIIGGKTGNTDGALGCLLLVVKIAPEDATLISIVVGSRTRFSDTRTLIPWAQRAYRW
jgi:D-alanyl-D-alanine carboxypeptidase (penicillin-binding protein 5/6)